VFGDGEGIRGEQIAKEPQIQSRAHELWRRLDKMQRNSRGTKSGPSRLFLPAITQQMNFVSLGEAFQQIPRADTFSCIRRIGNLFVQNEDF
jgi:hypothetical protein